MKKFILLASVIMFTINLNTARAGCNLPANGKCKVLKTSGSCGTGCTYVYDNNTKTVNITASGNNAKIEYGAFHSQFYENNILDVNRFIVNGKVKISDFAFSLQHATIISGKNDNLVLSGIGTKGFGDLTINGNVIIPAEADIGTIAFHGVKFNSGAKLYCAIKNCAQKLIDSCKYASPTKEKCLSDVKAIIFDENKFEQAPDGCDFWSQNGCSKCSTSSFRLEDNWCLRKIYTPAEAAEVLRDDNSNEILITFKK